jgi:tetratricopeptide (TPR) repeat protein
MTEPGEFLGLVARAELRSASGDWAEAAALWGQVTDGNPVHGDYWARLAEARFAAGDYAGAREAYQKVLELGVRAEYRWPSEGELPDLQPGVVAYRIACCLAALGQRDEAIDALAVALDRGYRYLAQARDDECWKPWLDDARLRDLLGLPGTGLTRDEGWRADLRLLAREIKRLAYAPFALMSEEEFDLRWNGGGNTFLTRSLLHHLIACREISRPGALFVVIGRQTFSAAQNTATAIGRETAAIFVGEPTGSRPNFIGETIYFEMPYSKVRANAADLFWQTSWPTDYRTWIAPHIYAPPTFAAYSRNDDPAMDAILSLREQFPGP